MSFGRDISRGVATQLANTILKWAFGGFVVGVAAGLILSWTLALFL